MKGIILTFLLSLAVCSQSLSAKDKITEGTTPFSQGIDRVVSHNWQYQKRLEPKVGVLVYGSLCACYAWVKINLAVLNKAVCLAVCYTENVFALFFVKLS